MVKLQEDVLIGIGDLHGHYPALQTLLSTLDAQYDLFPEQDYILRDNATMAFTGDYIDRGEQSLQVMEEVRKLQELNGNNVIALMGNHELLALECFDAARRIEEWISSMEFSVGKGFNEYYDRTIHGRNGGTATIRSFFVNGMNPFEHYIKRMSRDGGDIRDWMKKLYQFAVMDFLDKKILFVHADVPEHFNCLQDIEDYDILFNEFLSQKTGPIGDSLEKYNHSLVREGLFWSRLFGNYTENEICNVVDCLGMDFIVTGHTPHKGKIVSYFDRVFDIDVGMCPAYGENTPTAIVFKKEGVYGFYSDGGERRLTTFL